ncbi:amidohydrolase [Agromyces rhizosphaerae]|uniref:Amidohydrolase n=1 Tax=Agromyces rhizosphaerae TaxID=88374 RepID=A0A9W6FSG7_9MICO|nr:amidohydrolase family protein [Agromyces rhizosphaerae]GLI28727.1 amidohydrolase [Agromyces rhizosphaerae]
MTDLVVAGARPLGSDAPVDVEIAGGRITAVVPAGTGDRGAPRIEADGRTVLPGLWDRHVHASQWAQRARRVDVSSAVTAAEAAALAGEFVAGRDEVVGMGYQDALWPDAPDRALLDAATGDVPVALVSHDLHACWLNSAALARHGRPGHPTGVLREEEAFDVVRVLDDVGDEQLDAWVGDAMRAAAARGIVGVVDLEMRWNAADWTRRVRGGLDAVRVEFGVYTQHLDRAIEEGLRTGDVLPGTEGLVAVGPYKVLTDGALNTRTAWCVDPYPDASVGDEFGLATVAPEHLLPLLQRATAAGLVPAVHAIGDRANREALAVLAQVDPVATPDGPRRGSIEHAQLLRREDLARFAELGVVASVQPEHAMDDRDVAEHHWAGRTDRAFMLRSLVEAGAELALGSDAPVAPLDPWITIAAAVGRTRDGRAPWHPEQAIDARTAIDASTRTAIAPGERADLVLVDLDPVAATPEELRTMPVAATLLAGRATHLAI